MKINLKRHGLVWAVLTGLAATTATAQVQIGLGGAHFSGTENGAKFSDGQWGGGVTVRYFITPKFDVGLNGRYFTRSESGLTLSVIPVTGQAEFFFTEGKIRPYVGAEAGVYIARAKVDIFGVKESDSNSNFGAAPKAGIQILFTDKIGLDLNAGYHLIFPKKNQGDETTKVLILGAGLVFNVGGGR